MSEGRAQKGFTIVELIVVIVVIAILATISIVAYNGIQGRARSVALASGLRNAAEQLLIDQATSGRFPASLEEANDGKGITINDTDLWYADRNSATPSGFCITGVSHSIAYMVTQDAAPVEGACEEHADEVAGGGDSQEPGGDEDGEDETPPPLNPALVAAYGFNETSGTTFANQVPGGPVATLWSGAQITAGHTGNAVVGTSNHQAAVVSGSPAFSTQGWSGLTVGFWTSRITTASDPITFWNNSSRGSDWGGVYYNGTTGFGVWLHTAGDNWPGGDATGAIPVGSWHYIAYTWSGSANQVKYYIDGSLVKTKAASGATIAENTAILDIGGNDDYGGSQTAGKIDDLRIYNAALSDTEIATDMITPVP